MSLKTTLFLLLLVATGIVLAIFGPSLGSWLNLSPDSEAAGSDDTLAILKNELTKEKLTRIEVHEGEKVVALERSGSDWTLPGKWPTRKREVEELINLLTGLRSRFAPIAMPEEDDLKDKGLDKPAAIVLVWTGDKKHTLAFGKGTEEGKGDDRERRKDSRTIARRRHTQDPCVWG